MQRSIFILTLLLTLATLTLAQDPLAKIWQGKHNEARSSLQAMLKTNPKNTVALRGLALLSGEEDIPLEQLQYWQRYYAVAADSWPALVYWPMIADTAEQTGHYAQLEAMAHSVLAAPKAHPALRHSAREVLADALARAGKFTEANAAWQSMGYLRTWRVIGPFDNVSTSGFDKAYPPETEINFSKKYTGLNNLVLPWRALPLVMHDGACQPEEFLGAGDPSVFYAVSAVKSPLTQQVTLNFDPTGASKIFVNGRLVFADNKYRSPSKMANPYSATVTLRAGWNTIMVKIASNEDDSATFRLRFAKPSGADITGLVIDPAQAKSETATVADGVNTETVEPTIASLLRKLPRDIENTLALGYVLYLAHDYEGAAAVLRETLATAPDAVCLHALLAITLTADDQADEARAERVLVRNMTKRIVDIELDDLQDQADALPSEEHIQRLRNLCVAFPQSPSVRWELADTYQKEDMKKEAVQSARLALKLASGVENYGHLLSLLREEDMKTETQSVLSTAFQLYPYDTHLLQFRAVLLSSEGKEKEAIAIYQKLLPIADPEADTYQLLATLYTNLQNRQAARQMLLKACQLSPQNAESYSSLGDVQRELGQKKEALVSYQQALAIDPAMVALRDKMRLLTGAKPIVELAPATDGEPIITMSKTMKAPANTSSIILLNEARLVVYPDFTTDGHYRKVIKVFDKAGVQQYQEVELNDYSGSSDCTVEKARIIKPNGKIVDTTHDSYSSASFPSLEAGDTVDVAYRISDYNRGALSRHFWSNWDFDAQNSPVTLSRLVIITPPDMAFQTRAHGEIPTPSTQDVNGWRIQEWKMADLPALTYEQMTPAFHDTGHWLDISTVTSWSEIVRWYRDLADPRCIPDNAIRAKAKELTKDAQTETEKIKALVAFVSQQIQYQSAPFRMSHYVPTEGKEVLRDRYGDCKDKAALLKALLAVIGVSSDMVLLSSRDNGITPFLPSPRFTHAILCIQRPEGPFWVDPTCEQMAFGGFPIPDQGVPALIINAATTDLTTIPVISPELTSTQTGNYNLVLDDNGKLTGTLDIQFAGNIGWMLRSSIKRVPVANHEMVLRVLTSRLVPDAVYESGNFEALEEIDIPLVIHLKFHADNYSTKLENFLSIPTPWLVKRDEQSAIFEDPKRKQDLEIGPAYGQQRYNCTITLPTGYTPIDMPALSEQTCPSFSYRLTYQVENNTLHGEISSTFSSLRIPITEYAAFSDVMKKFYNAAEKKLIFKK